MDTSSIDDRLRETYKRSAPVVNEATFEARLRRSTSKSEKRAFAPRRTNGLRVAVYASLAVVIVAAITIGSLEAVEHLGKDQPILVISDDTTGMTPGATGQDIQAPATDAPSGMFRGNLQRTGVYPSGGPSEAPELLWKVKVAGAENSSPVISDGVVYVGSKDGYLYALDAKSGREKWKFDAYGPVYGSPGASDGVVCFVGGSERGLYGSLFAVDAQTGQEKWSWMYVGWSSPAIFDGMIYMGSSAKDLETGLKGWSVETGGVDGTCASIWGGVVYFGVTGYFNGLYAVDIGGEHLADTYDGTSLIKPLFATEDPPTGITGAVAISGGVAYFGNHFDSSFVAVDLQTAQEKWRFKASEFRYPEFIGQFAMVSPAVSSGLLYGGSEDDGHLYAVDIETGQEVWRVALDITELSSPSLSGTTLYVGSKDGYLYALDAQTGQELWKFQTGGAISSSPAIWDGVVYFASEDGYLYAVG